MRKYHQIDVYIYQCVSSHIIEIRKFYVRKIVNIFLPINLNVCLGAQKNRLIETVLLSTHNICVDEKERK